MPKKVVVASGYFNPLHYGHVSYLEKALERGRSIGHGHGLGSGPGHQLDRHREQRPASGEAKRRRSTATGARAGEARALLAMTLEQLGRALISGLGKDSDMML